MNAHPTFGDRIFLDIGALAPLEADAYSALQHFDVEVLKRGVGIRFKGRQRTDIEEYSIPEGWVRVQAGKTMDRKGNPLTLKLSGPVEAWFEDLGDDAPVNRIG